MPFRSRAFSESRSAGCCLCEFCLLCFILIHTGDFFGITKKSHSSSLKRMSFFSRLCVPETSRAYGTSVVSHFVSGVILNELSKV